MYWAHRVAGDDFAFAVAAWTLAREGTDSITARNGGAEPTGSYTRRFLDIFVTESHWQS